ncbi:HEAT repeat domain-containing protein [Chryseobacterium viscerum]|uniref:HEAT repeat domain-containing protein n=1 Tax=Chryseobacterium viscerum TaxID=1037377 RepID=UPI00064623F7|nr:HEAT repeat domain-containing protein [Chryseobacterium viscerum]MCW1963165.1 HEAT repeat domain-containing protein [Chryseobacterium viscerum]
MTIEELIKDKTVKSKEKVDIISKWIIDTSLPADELIAFAEKSKDPVKATCIEAIEYATKQNPSLADETVFSFVTQTLTEKAPRIKWESAKVIGNTAHLFPENLDQAISNLLGNTEHEGTVVRWSAAFALGEILKLKTPHNSTLLPALEGISEKEEKNSIKKIYLDAIKKTKK